MKKFKLIPVLAVSMLLAACQAGVKVSKPKFAAEGNEVKLEDYQKALDEAFKASEWAKEDLKVGSKELKSSTSTQEVTIKKLNDKEIYKDDQKSLTQSQMQGDADNNVIVTKSTMQGERKVSSKEGKQSQTASEKAQSTLQVGKVKVGDKEVEGIVQTNDITKQYVLEDAFDETTTKDNWYTQQFVGLVGSLTYVFQMSAIPSPLSSEEELAKYKFYQNDKIFTTKYVDEEDPSEQKVTVEGKEVVVAKSTKKAERTIQLDLTDGKMALRIAVESSEKTEYLENYSDFDEVKGTVVTEENKNYMEMTLNDKKVSLKAVDLAKYEYIDFIA